ncbi:DUF1778 domain-containing protein [Rhodococcus sp. NPDC060086]|uniref:plasmid mobilization protein n=1 Tax=Rhodococcus sp. NPDC060086 TaxID=3347055 RepID=UPI003652C09A
MPALNIQFTEDEQSLIREAAEREGVSLKAFVRNVALDAASSRKHLRDALLTDIFDKSAELNDRLA